MKSIQTELFDLLMYFIEIEGTTPQGALQDLLTELRFITAMRDIADDLDFDKAVEGSLADFEEEMQP